MTDKYVTTTGSDTYANASNSGTPMSLTTAFAGWTAGDTIWVKAGTYTRTGTDTPTGDGTIPLPIGLRGYNSTIGDLDSPTYNADGSLVTTNYPVIAYDATFRLSAAGAEKIIYQNLKITANVSNPTLAMGIQCAVINCYISNSSANSSASCVTLNSDNVMENCDISLVGTTTNIAVTTSANSRVLFNRFLASAGFGVGIGGSGTLILGNVFFDNVAKGAITITTTTVTHCWTIIANTIYGADVGITVSNAGFTTLSYIGNNHITDCVGKAIESGYDGTAQLACVFSHNRLRDNAGSPTINGFDGWLAATSFNHVTTDTGGAATDYTDAATDQYGLISGAPGAGAALPPNRDIGALQRAASGSSGGLLGPNMRGFFQ